MTYLKKNSQVLDTMYTYQETDSSTLYVEVVKEMSLGL